MDPASAIMADGARLLQYLGAVVLFGTAWFNLTRLPRSGEASASRQAWPKPLFISAAAALLIGSILSLLAQSATMNGMPLAKLDLPALDTVLADTQWGHATAARIALALLAVVITLILRLSTAFFVILAGLGALCLTSFAFTGHGAADDGPAGTVHLLSDMIHSVAAGVWLGALAGFLILLTRRSATNEPHRAALAQALSDFSSTGTLMVATLVVTGLVNGYFLVGIQGLGKIFTSAYGRLLVLKLILFTAMVGLAAVNRFRLLPALKRPPTPESHAAAIFALRRSVTVEALFGIAVLGLVAVFGMMEPPASM